MLKGPGRVGLRGAFTLCLVLLALTAVLSFTTNGWSLLQISLGHLTVSAPDYWLRLGRFLLSGLALGMLAVLGFERLAAEEALEARNRELTTERTYVRHLVDHVPLGIAAFDPNMNYRWVNDFYAALGGRPREWFVGRSLYEVWPGSRADFEQPSREILASGQTLTYKAWRTPSLPGRYWDITGLPLYDQDRNPEGLLVLVQDVTEQTKVSRLQRTQLQKLQELDRLKDHLLSNLSHELKTPISLIVGYTELLQDQYPEEPLLQGILDGNRRLVAHLNALLDYSAMITGSLPLYMTEICFKELLAHAGEIEHEALAQKHLQLERTVAPDLPPVVADARRLTQVVVELLDNAIKHTPEHGRLGLEVTASGDGVRLTVWDSGSGVAPAEAGRIWEPFLQAATDGDRKGGLGLGLAIVRQLVTMHGGRVEVAPRPEGGSCFHVYLPAAPAT